MKRYFSAVTFLLLLSFTAIVIYGCGQTSSSTTSGTVPAAQGATAKAAVLMASGGASIGVAATGVGGSAGTSVAIQSVLSNWGLHAMMGNPPPAFFTQDMTTGTASVDGYFNPLATPPLGGKMTPYIRLNTVGGSIVAGPYFSGKKIAYFSPYCSVEAIFAGSPTQAPVGINNGMQSFMTKWNANPSSAYTSIKYMGDYLCWAYIYPTIEVKANASSHPLPGGAHLTTPLAGANDLIASMDNKMVFSGPVTGELDINMICWSDGRTKVGTYSGTGKLTTSVATMDVTNSVTFDTAGNPPSLVTIVATNESSPFYTTKVYITNPSTGVGTGEIWDYTASPVAQIGTLIISATSSSVTVGVTTETFTF